MYRHETGTCKSCPKGTQIMTATQTQYTPAAWSMCELLGFVLALLTWVFRRCCWGALMVGGMFQDKTKDGITVPACFTLIQSIWQETQWITKLAAVQELHWRDYAWWFLMLLFLYNKSPPHTKYKETKIHGRPNVMKAKDRKAVP